VNLFAVPVEKEEEDEPRSQEVKTISFSFLRDFLGCEIFELSLQTDFELEACLCSARMRK
jgi:hypothetical protein